MTTATENGHAKAPTTNRLEMLLPKLEVAHLGLKLIGDSPLVTHAWSEKAKKQMLDKQMKKAKAAKEAKDPFVDFVDSLYWLSKKPAKPTDADVKKGEFGLPAISFKKCAVDACTFVDGVTKVESRGAFHVQGEYVKIIGQPPKMRQDMVRIAMGTSDIRYRGEFWPWSVEIDVRYNSAHLSPEQIVHLFNVAGFSVGVGENRPQRNGSWGMFHVE